MPPTLVRMTARCVAGVAPLAVLVAAGGAPGTESAARVRATTHLEQTRPPGGTLDSARLAAAYARAAELPRLRSLLVEWKGRVVGERYFHGATRTRPANVKSVSKSIVSALVGIAIEQQRIRGLDATIAELLPVESRSLDPAKRAITVEDLVSMRAGLASTSFGNYGAFVTSRNWVRYVLSRPMVAEPGGPMIYSTGSTHLLSAILTRATRTSTYGYAQRTLARPLGIPLRPWTTDPQGIYFGGNEMRMTPREMLAFGRLYLNRGRAPNGRQIVPAAWIDSSWVPRGVSPWNGHSYGYGWWIREAHGHPIYFAWGYGGQFIFVVPSLQLVVVTTSDASAEREGGHLEAVHALVDTHIIPAVGGGG